MIRRSRIRCPNCSFEVSQTGILDHVLEKHPGGRTEIIRGIVEGKLIELDAEDSRGETMLRKYAKKNDVRAVKALIDAGADVKQR